MIAVFKRASPNLPLAGALLLSFGLGLFRLGYQAALGDDAFSLLIAGRDLGELLRLSANEPHPPVFYLLLWGWVRLAGDSEFAGRFVAVWWAVLSVALVYRLGRSCGDRATGSWAACLLAANPFFIAYSQQARMYTMVIALGLASMHFASRLLPAARRMRKEGSRQAADGQAPGRAVALGYVLATVLAVATHFFALFLVAAQNVLVVLLALFRRDWLRLVRWLALQALWAIVYLPWIALAFPTLSTYRNELVSRPRLDEAYERTLRAFVLGEAAPVENEWLLLAVFGWVALWGAYACLRRGRWLVLAYSLLPPLIVFAVSLVRPMYFERYMLVFLPGFVLLLASAMDRLRGYRRWRVALGVLAPLAAAVMVLPGYYSQTRYATAADMRGMVGYLSAMAAPDAAVVTNLPASDPTFGYYYRQAWPLSYLPETQDAVQLERRLAEVAAGRGEIWYLPYGAERAVVEPWLDSHGVKVTDQWYSDARLVRYLVRDAGASLPQVAMDARFDSGISLVAAGLPAGAESGRPMTLWTEWRAASRPATNLQAFVHLVDAGDRIWGQWDGAPGGVSRATSSWRAGEIVSGTVGLVVLPGTPPGSYRLVAGLYDTASGKRSALSGGGDRVEMGAITVARAAKPLAVEAYQIQRRLEAPVAPGLGLAGASLTRLGGGSAEALLPGQVLHVTTFWQAGPGAVSVPALKLTLAAADGRAIATASPGPLDGLGDPASWRPGESVRGQSYLFLSGDLAPGAYRVLVSGGEGSPVILGEVLVTRP